MRDLTGRAVPRSALGMLAAGAAIFALSLTSTGTGFAKLPGDSYELVGTVLLLIGAFIVIRALSSMSVTHGLYGIAAAALMVARVSDLLQEFPDPIGQWYDRHESVLRLIERITESSGCIGVLLVLLALLYEMARLRDTVVEHHRRYVDLHESSLFLARVAERAADAVIGVDLSGHIRTWNRGAEVLFGYSAREAVGMHFGELIEGCGDCTPERFAERVQAGYPVDDWEVKARHRNGETSAAQARCSLVVQESGEPIGVSVVVRDLELVKSAQRELAAARDLLANALESVGVGLFILDRRLVLLEYNKWMVEFTGYTEEEVNELGPLHVCERSMPFTMDEIQAYCLRLFEGGDTIEFKRLKLVRRDRSERICHFALSPLRKEDGAIFAAVGVMVDITEREELHAQLLASQKMESLGRMAGGIAHDFNNILVGALGYASLMREQVRGDTELLRCIDAVEDSVRRASELTHQLLAFARGAPCEFRPVLLNDLLQETLRLFAHSLGPDVETVFESMPEEVAVEADASQLKQVFMNLLINARDAIDGAGRIVVRVEHDPSEAPGDGVRVAVADTGRGMPPEVQQRIFEPFFTTREKGYGLGLAVVYGIVTSHGGRMAVHSQPGVGTRIEVCLPRSRRTPAPRTERPRFSAYLAAGHETVLLVEDEALVRAVATEVLQSCGYTVMPAATGAEAIAQVTEYAEDVALAVLDLVMPGLNGVETFHELRRIRPSLPCVFASGYGAAPLAEQFAEDDSVRVLHKPFEARELAGAVRELLDRDGRPLK